MHRTSFIDGHSVTGAFLGFRVSRLADLIVAQGDSYLSDCGLDFPARAVSTILMIDERSDVSVSGITAELDQPHQLVAQRVDLLIEQGLVSRTQDPADNRRKILKLTRKGKHQVAHLKVCLSDAAKAFEFIFAEIGVDLNKISDAAFQVFSKAPLSDRVKALDSKVIKTAE